ncbi:Zn-ribbon domain-containing OB-fold protein [Labrys neptuniae]
MANSQAILSLYDQPLWQSLERRKMALPKCSHCGRFRYPPGPICAECHSLDYEWTEISGEGRILSWVVFHRQYFEDHPPPYNAIAVRLAEGPILVSNLVGEEPQGSWIDRQVTLTYRSHLDRTQHAFRLKTVDGNG